MAARDMKRRAVWLRLLRAVEEPVNKKSLGDGVAVH